jgi:prevent-host-death family protein
MSIIGGYVMREFTTVDLLRDLKTVTHAAAREPVAITQHRKPRFVLMALEDFERLKAGNADSRKVYRIEETPPELADLLADGLDRIIESEDEAHGA